MVRNKIPRAVKMAARQLEKEGLKTKFVKVKSKTTGKKIITVKITGKIKPKKGEKIKPLPKGVSFILRGIKGFKLPKAKPISREQLAKTLSSRREQTLRRIIESRGASPIAKARARRLLGE